ncbi:MAG: hypothetical protein H8Z69_03390 [Nanohaloarchaea archaeon]|nr:hypothetical protein [Candidatus Nanohaloarchaea archaeon]
MIKKFNLLKAFLTSVTTALVLRSGNHLKMFSLVAGLMTVGGSLTLEIEDQIKRNI